MKRGKWGMGKNVCQSQNEYCGKEKDLSIVLYMLFKISSFYFFEKRANYKPPPSPRGIHYLHIPYPSLMVLTLFIF